MLLEDLLVLPVGTRVRGRIDVPTTLNGVVACFEDGSRFIRWDDGYATVPLGKVRECDEYIAAHTQIDHGPRRAVHDDAADSNEAIASGVGTRVSAA